MTGDMDDRRRFFIVTVGRTGSSLLAAILTDAGADFGVPPEGTWDPAGGAYEHPALDAVVGHFGHMNEIAPRRPHGVLTRLRWSIARHRAKAGLKALLPRARYFKGDVDALVHWAARLGYAPVVIVSYRRFGEVLRGLGHLHPQPPDVHAEKYDTVLRNGLALASIYGGCTVDYRELVDGQETAWAAALGEVTGLAADALLAARAARLDIPSDDGGVAPEPFPGCAETYEILRRYKGLAMPPSRATRRLTEE